MDARELKSQRLALERVDPNITSVGTVIEGIIEAKRDWIWQTFLAIFIFVQDFEKALCGAGRTGFRASTPSE